MDFGKLNDISKVNFSLPPDHTDTLKTLKKQSTPPPLEVYVGCPVWSCEEWVGKWYPEKTQSKDYLKYYAQQFNTIELNTTHYRIPDFQTIEKWRENTLASFRFCPKILQTISHDQMLQNVENLLQAFCDSVWELGEKLGICFLQLPPYFSPDKLYILENFVKIFPKEIQLSVEFRHEDWFKAKNGQIPLSIASEMLENNGISTVICDVSGRRDVLHQRLTSTTAVIRFVGNSLHITDYQRLDEWIERIAIWKENGLGKLYFFMHEPDNVLSPDLVVYFIEKLNQTCGLHLPKPTVYQSQTHTQTKLF
jgi:uncharacterized protein YecE (DUF72 family)